MKIEKHDCAFYRAGVCNNCKDQCRYSTLPEAPQPATQRGVQEVFDNWNAYLHPVDREDFKAQLLALSRSEKPAIPEGWKLVPPEPTESMIDEAADVYPLWPERQIEKTPIGEICTKLWKAMLAAAPSPDGNEEKTNG